MVGKRVYLKQRSAMMFGIDSCGTVLEVDDNGFRGGSYLVKFDEMPEDPLWVPKVGVLQTGEREDFSKCKFQPGTVVLARTPRGLPIQGERGQHITTGMVGIVLDYNVEPYVLWGESLGAPAKLYFDPTRFKKVVPRYRRGCLNSDTSDLICTIKQEYLEEV